MNLFEKSKARGISSPYAKDFMAYNAGHKKQLATDAKPAAPAKQTILGSVLDRVRID